ncbi:MAG: DegT/DnrJ/EryC1/StrS family aminotransferase, partial [Firmicutes bacterium]|nr:DegT/DnrJ/EryC1/StrS family aminotransferase [Bacillota bacterium]
MNQEQKQLLDILDHEWGTIGPKSLEAGKALASYCGLQYGLTLFSASAAFEAALRGQSIGFGDQVIVAAYGDPLESMTTALVGATPVFADIDPETLTLTAET